LGCRAIGNKEYETGCGWKPGVVFPTVRGVSLLFSVQTGSGVHPASYPTCNWSCFPGPKANHSPPSSAEVENGGAVSPLPPCLHGIRAVLDKLSRGITSPEFEDECGSSGIAPHNPNFSTKWWRMFSFKLRIVSYWSPQYSFVRI
jgi:hypothetical protein